MKNILMAGSLKNLIEIMKNEGNSLVSIEMPLDTDEQTATFILNSSCENYYYKTKVIYQANEIDEFQNPIAINVIDIKCTLENKGE